MSKKDKFVGILGDAVKQKESAEDIIKQKIVIRDELKILIPPLSVDELTQLELNILAEGCRDALILWKDKEDYVLIDGHNRFAICKKHSLDFNFQLIDFKNIEEAKDWMINNQLGKRNVSEDAKSYLRGKQYSREKKQGSRTDLALGENAQKSETRERLAKQYKVSAKTIQRDEKYAESIDKLVGNDSELKWNILNRLIILPKNMVEELAKNSGKSLEDLRNQLKKGGGIKVSAKTIEVKPKIEKPEKIVSEENNPFELIKTNILKAFKEAIDKKDKKAIEKIKKYVAELEKVLFG